MLSTDTRRYLLLWLNQLAATAGSAMAAFALSVWIYEHTASISQFALALVGGTLPGLLLAPWAGNAADRWDTRRIVFASDAVSMLIIALTAWLAHTGQLGIWQVYACMVLLSCAIAFRTPAALVLSQATLPVHWHGRISGLLQFADALARLAVPALAGWCLQRADMAAVLWLTGAGFALAPLAIWLVPAAPPRTVAARQGAAADFLEAPRYLWRQRTLCLVFAYSALVALVFGLISTLYRPMMLARHSVDVLGLALSAGGIGMLAASILAATLGAHRHTLAVVLGADLLLGCTVAALGLQGSPYLACALMFAASFWIGLAQCHTQTLWLKEIPQAMQGRFFAFSSMVKNASMPVAALAGGVIADLWFEPWLAPGGRLAATAGKLVGTGQGNGIGLMFVLAGLATALLAGAALLLSRSLRRQGVGAAAAALS